MDAASKNPIDRDETAVERICDAGMVAARSAKAARTGLLASEGSTRITLKANQETKTSKRGEPPAASSCARRGAKEEEVSRAHTDFLADSPAGSRSVSGCSGVFCAAADS